MAKLHAERCSSAALLICSPAHLQPCHVWYPYGIRLPSTSVNMRLREKTYAAGKRVGRLLGPGLSCAVPTDACARACTSKEYARRGSGLSNALSVCSVEKGTSKGHLYVYCIPPPQECLRVSKPGHENRPRRFCWVCRKLAKDALLFAARAPYYPATSCDHKSPTCNLLKRSTFCLKFQTLCLVLRAVQYLLNLLRCLLRHCFHLPHWKGKKRTAFVKLC